MPGRLVSQQSSGSSVQPPSSPHTGSSSLGNLSSSFSQTPKKEESSLSESLTSPSGPSLDKNSSSSPTGDAGDVEGNGKEIEEDDGNAGGVETQDNKEAEEDGEDQNSLTQLQDIPEYSEVVALRNPPPLPLRSPAKISFQDSSWDVGVSQLSEVDVRNETSLRLRMSQSQSSDGITSDLMLDVVDGKEEEQVGGAGDDQADKDCRLSRAHRELGGEGGAEEKEAVSGDSEGGWETRKAHTVCRGVVGGRGDIGRSVRGGSKGVTVAGVGVAEESGERSCDEEENEGGGGVSEDSQPSQQGESAQTLRSLVGGEQGVGWRILVLIPS